MVSFVYLIHVIVTILLHSCVHARDYTFTFLLEPGKTECFFEKAHEEALLELEYQVIEGGELDVDFYILDPNQQSLTHDYRRMDGLHSFDLTLTGEYSLCFANEFSRMSHKLIYFDVIIEDSSDDDVFERDADDSVVLDMKVQDIRKILSNLSQHLNKAELNQQFFRAREARHRHSLENSNSRVMWWSCINCAIMFSVGILQVYVIRSLFRSHRQDRIRT